MNQVTSPGQVQVQNSSTQIGQQSTISVANKPVFPTGLNVGDYRGVTSWSNRRWAWEFLRRNPQFQKFCHDVDSGQLPQKEVKTKLAESFCLLKFKHYRDNYWPKRPCFSSAQVSVWSDTKMKPYSERRSVHIFLAPGEIIFRVSLRDALHSKKRKALLDSIEESLKAKAELWGENNNAEPTATAQRGDLFPLLRILDLVAYVDSLPKSQRITRTQIFSMVYPSLAWTPSGQPHSPGQFDKPFNERWKVARKYTTPEWYSDLAATKP